MSVFARIAAHLTKKSPWQDISMIYFNAWPEQNKGYNHFETMDQRAGVFNNALTAMDCFKPDMILIACNTLSVIYPFTSYSQNTEITVSGIVDHGVQLIHENLMADPDSHVIIFGTPTTIADKTHQRKLIKMGIDPDRITSQGCINLAGKAVSKMCHPVGKVYAALCCTHFGYCRNLFQDALSKHLKGNVLILNPNERMADHVMEDQGIKHSGETSTFSPGIDMHVVSRVFWEPERIDAYVSLLKNISPETVKALAGYELNPGLFEI